MDDDDETNSLCTFYKITGVVKNNCGEPIDFVDLRFTLYDQSGKVLKTDSTYTSPTTIPDDDSAAFEMSWCYDPNSGWSKDVSSRPQKYDIIAEGTPDSDPLATVYSSKLSKTAS